MSVNGQGMICKRLLRVVFSPSRQAESGQMLPVDTEAVRGLNGRLFVLRCAPK